MWWIVERRKTNMPESHAPKRESRPPGEKGAIVENCYLQWRNIKRKDMIVLGCFFLGLLLITILASGIIVFFHNCCGVHLVDSGK